MTKQEALKLLLKYHGEDKVSKSLIYIDSAIDEALKQQREYVWREIERLLNKNCHPLTDGIDECEDYRNFYDEMQHFNRNFLNKL